MARRRTTSPITLEWDEDGVHIQIDTSELRYVVLELDGATMRGVMSAADAWDFYEHVQDALGDWYREGSEQRANVRAHRDPEGVPLEDDAGGLDPLDPDHPRYADNVLEMADVVRDRERGK